MAEWSLQHAAEIINGAGYKVKSQHLLDNFSGLNSAIGDRLNKVTATAQSFVSAVTWAAQQTFTSGLKTDTISENTPNNGISVDGVACKDSMVTVTGTPAAAGQIGYGDNILKYNNGTSVIDLVPLPKYLTGPTPTYTSAASITLPEGLTAMDSTGTILMTVASDQVVNITSAGANGLDASTEANDTWYYVYLIGSSTDAATYPTKGIFSTVNEANTGSITLPANYDIKRQLPLAVRNDGSGDFIKFTCPRWGEILYNVAFEGGTGGATYVLSGGTSASFASVSCASFVPPISRVANLYLGQQTNVWAGRVRSAGEAHNGLFIGINGTVGGGNSPYYQLVNSSQAIEYLRSAGSGSLTVAVAGYVVTEVA